MTPYLGEMRMFAGNFAPRGWALCEGQQVLVSANEDLFKLIGTTYGGDGTQTFNLPDLRGRLPLHQGTGSRLPTYVIGQKGGEETVALIPNQMPRHSHDMQVSRAIANTVSPNNSILAVSTQASMFFGGDPESTTMDPGALGAVGGSQPHNNMQPYLCISFIISLYGVYPPRN